MDGYVVDKEAKNWIIPGIALRGPLKPILTTPVSKNYDDDDDQDPAVEEESCCTTPTSQESRIPTRLACPPAPKKRKPSSKSCYFNGVREFFNPPHDLESVFIRRAEKA